MSMLSKWEQVCDRVAVAEAKDIRCRRRKQIVVATLGEKRTKRPKMTEHEPKAYLPIHLLAKTASSSSMTHMNDDNNNDNNSGTRTDDFRLSTVALNPRLSQNVANQLDHTVSIVLMPSYENFANKNCVYRKL